MHPNALLELATELLHQVLRHPGQGFTARTLKVGEFDVGDMNIEDLIDDEELVFDTQAPRRNAATLLSLEEACSRYTLTVDEFLSWQFSIDQHGLAGLRTTRIQQYRQ